MTAIHRDAHAALRVGLTARRRVGLLLAATAVAWMTATIIAVAAAAIGAIPAKDAVTITVTCTVGLAALLSGHFWRLGHVDEPLVLGLLVSWAVTLGLLSL